MQNVASQFSSFTYDPAKHELVSSYLSLDARKLVLSALELLPACTALTTTGNVAPPIEQWHFQSSYRIWEADVDPTNICAVIGSMYLVRRTARIVRL